MKTGIYTHEPRQQYNDDPGMRSSVVAKGDTSTKHMRHAATTENEQTDAMVKGTCLHLALLEAERFENEVAIYPGKGNRGSKEYKEFVLCNPGTNILLPAAAREVVGMVESVLSDPRAKDFLAGCKAEVAFYWETEEYGRGKALLDGWGSGTIKEIKTAAQITPKRFAAHAYDMKYHIRAGWYRMGVRELAGELLPVELCVIESKAPFDVAFYEYDEYALGVGMDRALEIATNYRACEKAGHFPGINQDIQTLHLPAWVRENEADMDKRLEKLDTMNASELV